MLDSDVATKNIKRLSKMSREEIEAEYKLTNKFALSDDDNIEQRVNDAFLKGEGLKEITINGKTYKGLLFDENSKQSKKLNDNDTFKAYHKKYIACMKEIISELGNEKEIDTDAISMALSEKLGRPNFSDYWKLYKFDYYGLMGGTQNIKIDFKITPTSKGEYNLETTMHISDWYGADKDDVNKEIDYFKAIRSMVNISSDIAIFPLSYKFIPSHIQDIDSSIENVSSNRKDVIPGLKELFWLQHHYGCKPFATQIIYKSEDKIKIDR